VALLAKHPWTERGESPTGERAKAQQLERTDSDTMLKSMGPIHFQKTP